MRSRRIRLPSSAPPLSTPLRQGLNSSFLRPLSSLLPHPSSLRAPLSSFILVVKETDFTIWGALEASGRPRSLHRGTQGGMREALCWYKEEGDLGRPRKPCNSALAAYHSSTCQWAWWRIPSLYLYIGVVLMDDCQGTAPHFVKQKHHRCHRHAHRLRRCPHPAATMEYYLAANVCCLHAKNFTGLGSSPLR